MSKVYNFLTNPKYSSISVVMLPEKMSIAETERDLITLGEYGLPVKEVIINKIFPPTNNDFLKSIGDIQRKNMEVIKKKFGHLKIKEEPYLQSEITGIKG